ncbi:sphingomyelin phosphodiesterase 2-like [Echinops telfairi]|uniref:Sphingomyelin phosphodiesterase 2-like n=1 Tax=Echinops telfairi TaxID=9371 RepID=A0AC55CSN1_ECHTE|nr:sphingomyelin phosphodiesterase 2-like [Echinops telfairi]
MDRHHPSVDSNPTICATLAFCLNLHPKDLGCRLLKEWTGLQDAYLETQDFQGCEEGCTMVPHNCYVNQQELQPFPFGIRIDYVLYKAVSGVCVSCKTLKTTTGHDPLGGTPLSDHEALMATLCVRHSPPQDSPSLARETAEMPPLVTVLKEASMELGLGLAQAHWWLAFASCVVGGGLLFLVLLCALVAGGDSGQVALLLLGLSVGMVLGAGAVYLFHMQEAKGLWKTQAELQHVLGRAWDAQDMGSRPRPAQLLRQQLDNRAVEQ